VSSTALKGFNLSKLREDLKKKQETLKEIVEADLWEKNQKSNCTKTDRKFIDAQFRRKL